MFRRALDLTGEGDRISKVWIPRTEQEGINWIVYARCFWKSNTWHTSLHLKSCKHSTRICEQVLLQIYYYGLEWWRCICLHYVVCCWRWCVCVWKAGGYCEIGELLVVILGSDWPHVAPGCICAGGTRESATMLSPQPTKKLIQAAAVHHHETSFRWAVQMYLTSSRYIYMSSQNQTLKLSQECMVHGATNIDK